jgi:DNA helicase HerA-like ATPase
MELGHRFAVCGTAGYGKTFFMKRLFRSHSGTAIFFDTLGVLSDLVPYYRTFKVRPRISAWEYKPIFEHLKTGQKLVLDLSQLVPVERKNFADGLIVQLLYKKWANLALFFDEAHQYVPQKMNIYSYEVLRAVQTARNNGITPMGFITQNLADVEASILSNCEAFAIFHTVYPTALKRLEELFQIESERWEELRRIITTLEIGEFVVYKNGNYTVYRR